MTDTRAPQANPRPTGLPFSHQRRAEDFIHERDAATTPGTRGRMRRASASPRALREIFDQFMIRGVAASL